MKILKQIVRVTSIGLRSVPSRLGPSLVIVVGMAGVVAVLLAVMAMARSVENTFSSAGRTDRAIVIRKGSESELASSLPRADVDIIRQAPGIRQRADGTAMASAESVVMVTARKKQDESAVSVVLRGVDESALDLRPEIQLTAGRMYRSGVREVIVGRSAHAEYAGLDVGDRIDFRGTGWTVVGVFTSNGSAYESEMLADVQTVIAAYNRNFFQSVRVQLADEAGLAALGEALSSDPRLTAEVLLEPEYYARQSAKLGSSLGTIVLLVGGIMALGAFFAALNTMYSAVSGRTVEIATLRALGFGSTAVIVSVLVEAMLLALAGGILGTLLVLAFISGKSISTLGDSMGLVQVAFALQLTPDILLKAFCVAGAVGVLGGLLPGLRSTRIPLASALRET